jgi:hypothetical protein
MQAQKNFEQAQKDVNLAMRQLEDEVEETQSEVEHWRSEIQKEKAFYASHGCTFNDNSLWSCPTGTPNYPLQEYLPTKQNN